MWGAPDGENKGDSTIEQSNSHAQYASCTSASIVDSQLILPFTIFVMLEIVIQLRFKAQCNTKGIKKFLHHPEVQRTWLLLECK